MYTKKRKLPRTVLLWDQYVTTLVWSEAAKKRKKICVTSVPVKPFKTVTHALTWLHVCTGSDYIHSVLLHLKTHFHRRMNLLTGQMWTEASRLYVSTVLCCLIVWHHHSFKNRSLISCSTDGSFMRQILGRQCRRPCQNEANFSR